MSITEGELEEQEILDMLKVRRERITEIVEHLQSLNRLHDGLCQP